MMDKIKARPSIMIGAMISLIGFMLVGVILIGYQTLFGSDPGRGKLQRSAALERRLLKDENLLEVCSPSARDPRVKSCSKPDRFKATLETVGARQISICEGTFFKDCSVLETDADVPAFSASAEVFFPDAFKHDDADFFGIEPQKSANVWTTLGNETSVEQAAAWLIESIKYRRRVLEDRRARAKEKKRDCETNRIIDDCD